MKNDTFFAVLLIIGKLINDKVEWNSFVTNLKALIEQYEEADIKLLEFPDGWEKTIYIT
ncbi:abortive infection bacteriophage resistance protein [Desulfitispora alkaliphila]